ncbi:MAG: Hpt domain-containing protein [Alistipes sp.]|nr:Hpt domain-containing protein [Alistipes sp.]
MTVEECYNKIGGNYEEVKGRLRDDARIIKFMGMFMRDQSFQTITDALAKQDYNEAFKGAHSLKGVSSNMAFTSLYEAVHELTEDLRGGSSSENTQSLYEKTKEAYEKVAETLKEFQDLQA